jgi:integrase
VGSSPTSGALLACSYEDLNSNKKDKSNDNLQNSSQLQDISIDQKKETIKESIISICKYQKNYVKNSLANLLEKSPNNTKIICKYIIAEQNEINIKELTKEGKIKTLIDIAKFLDFKDFDGMTKEDIFSYLNRFRKSEEIDPNHRWIGTWNNRHIVLLKFFRWLHDQDNPDIKNRKYPDCMQGIKRLRRKEVSRYKPSDLWTSRECEIFLKYCPSKRDRAYMAMAIYTSCRPSELLNCRIEDIEVKSTSDGSKQYSEITINGKTGQRTVPLIHSLPYVREWILSHPSSNNPKEWLFVSEGKTSYGKKITRDGLLKHFHEFYRDKYYPNLLININVPDSDKAFIRSLLTKPIDLYLFRHISLTEKSRILNEYMLRNHAGWSNTSSMPQVYIHHLGGASSKQLLQSFGIIEKEDKCIKENRIIICPNCNEPNNRLESNKFCFKCKMVISINGYEQVRNEDKQKITMLENDMEVLKEGMNRLFVLIQQNPVLAHVKPEVLEKTKEYR